MNLLFLPELFCQIISNLDDKEKIFLISCSKIIYNFKSLLILDSEYNIEEINDKLRMKNILIKDFSLENKIKELIKDLIPESIVVNSKYVKFISNNTNIKLFRGKKVIRNLVSYGYHYLAMKIMLNDNESINNINSQLINASCCGYLGVIKLLIDLGANVHARNNNNQAIIFASYGGHLSVVKLLIELGGNVHARNDQAIIYAADRGHLLIVKLLIESGANVHAQNNQAIINASLFGHLSVVKLLIESGADVHAQDDQAFKYADKYKQLDIIEVLENH